MAKTDGGSHKTLKSEHTRQNIVSTYLSLIHEKPWDKISVIELCRAASITRGTFYQYFSDIYDMMEQIETALLNDLSDRYALAKKQPKSHLNRDTFFSDFNPAPPEIFLVWFDFCQDNKESILPLLDRKNGDAYFVKRLKPLINDHIQEMMDRDGQPRDELRNHFVDIFIEIHFLSVQSWLSSDEAVKDVNVYDIVNLLNAMRVGSLYLGLKRKEDPESFDQVMAPQRY